MTDSISRRIVCIDDDKIQHILIKKRLLNVDSTLEIIPFEEPLKTLDWLKENSADLIFMDLNFPGLSGWDLLEKIKEISSTPVVVLTGNIGNEERAKREEFPQAIRLLEKPISSSQIEEIFHFLDVEK